jgi:hypothetical protein
VTWQSETPARIACLYRFICGKSRAASRLAVQSLLGSKEQSMKPDKELKSSVKDLNEQQLAALEHDMQIRRTISERVRIADAAATTLIPHDEVAEATRARLRAKLTNKGNA